MVPRTETIAVEPIRPHVGLAARAIPLLVAAGTLASFLGSQWWVLECLAHFRPHWAVVSLLVVAYSLTIRRPLVGLIGLACLMANVVPLAPYLFARSGEHGLSRTVRVMNANLHGDDAVLPRLRALLAKEQPDILLLTEVPPGLSSSPTSLFPEYPHTVFDRRGAFEVVVLSRWTLNQVHLDRRLVQLPILSAELCDPANPNACLTLVGLHGARPFGRTVRWRDTQLDRAAQVAAARKDQPVLLMGDLNLTPWSPVFARLRDTGNLRDGSIARGLTTTWNAHFLWLGVLIHHILINQKIAVLESRVAEDIGSDHRPVVADLAFR
jgi:endonuclease/exonuclease/phosphatase (EEP) superfamily protein YafD